MTVCYKGVIKLCSYSYKYVTFLILKAKTTNSLFSFFSFGFWAFWRTSSISGNAHFLGDFFIFGFYLLVHTGFELKYCTIMHTAVRYFVTVEASHLVNTLTPSFVPRFLSHVLKSQPVKSFSILPR